MALSKPSKVYFQTFKDSYSKDFPCIRSSSKGVKFAFCEVCRSDFNISHAGRFDVSRHVNGPKHKSNVNCAESNRKLNSFFQNEMQSDVTKAELLFTSFLVEHNVPISAADHAGPLFRKMFPKSEVAKKYGSARTKTTALIKEMAADKTSEVVKHLQAGPFAAACDGSNDTDYKLYPVVVSFFDPAQGIVRSSLLSIPDLIGDSTGANISNLILSEFERLEIPFKHCLALSADNASVMQGQKNGVVAFLKQHQSNLISIGCSCHLINLASEKGAKIIPAKVEDVLIDIYYYLNKSAKRKEALRHFQDLYNAEAQKILKHVCTRWLSLGRSLTRLVDQWEPLTSFFKDIVRGKNSALPENLKIYQIPKVAQANTAVEKDEKSGEKKTADTSSGKRVAKLGAAKRKKTCTKMPAAKKQKPNSVLTREETIFMFLSSPVNRAYSLFLLATIPTFEKANTLLQSESPLVHQLREILTDLLKELFSKFMKPSEVKLKSLTKVDFHNPSSHKDHKDLVIGRATSAVVAQLKEEEQNSFYATVIKYFVAVCEYIVKKFPLNSDVLSHAEIANLKKIENASFSSIAFFVELFPFLLECRGKESEAEAMDELEKEFCRLQLEDVSAIVEKHDRVDAQWAELRKMRGADGLLKYERLARIVLSILLIPHSNAECERIFSIVRKNRTESRSLMSNKTLENLLILKTTASKSCFEQTFSEEFLKKAKRATAASLSSAVASSSSA